MSKVYAGLALCLAVVLGFWIVSSVLIRPAAQVVSIPTTVALHGKTMGATYSVRYVPGSVPAEMPGKTQQAQLSTLTPVEIQSRIEGELRSIDSQLSTWNPESELSRFNAQQTTDWFDLTAETVELIRETRELSLHSSGKFDVTVGPLIELWGFGPSGRAGQTPSAAQIQTALEHVGIDKLELRENPPGARKLDPDLKLDLSSVGAGAAADRVSAMLSQLGLSDHFIDIAGEIVVRGHRADGQPWRVGIEEPDGGSREILTSIGLENEAIATSGNYRNNYVLDAQRLGHILDATSGYPAKTNVLSVTVVDARCSRADGLATLLMTLPAERGLALAEERGWCALIVARGYDAQEQQGENGPRAVDSPRLLISSRFKSRFPTVKAL